MNVTAISNSPITIEIRGGKPMVSSLMIADIFQRRHDNVLKHIRRLGLLHLEESYLNKQGKEQPVYWLHERESLILMPFLGGRKSLEGQTKLVDAYLAHHRAAEKRTGPEWKAIRDKTKVGFKWMTETLREVREAQGKTTSEYHYSNEARLISMVLSGAGSKLDRDSLSASDLDAVADLQRVNAILIAQNVPYQERKAALSQRFVGRLAA